MPNYRTTELPEGIRVTKIMSLFTTRFDCATLNQNRCETYPFWAMIYTLNGGITFRIGENNYHVRAGELIFYPASVPHSIVDTDDKSWEVSFVTFACESPIINTLAGRVFVPDKGVSDRINSIFRFGCKFFYNLPPKNNNTVGMYCNAGELELMRIKSELEAVLTRLCLTLSRKKSERHSEVFNIATKYMQDHLGDPITLEQLAREVGISVSTLKKAFRVESGGGVNSYYIDLKLSHAAKLLCESDLSVGEIADQLGFSTQFYLSEQFKSRYGLSPLAYRRQQERDCREFL